MANLYGSSTEKVTFNISLDLKKKVVALKDELNVSLSAIYNEAIANYIKQKELEKWQKGIELALKDKEYLDNAKELGSSSGDIYEY
jgi:predicted transcriptional regulator